MMPSTPIADPTTGRTAVTLISGQDETDLDAGLEPATLGDRVWWDANGNGIYNAGEAGQAGITVRLLTADGLTVLDTTTTAGDGTYSFAVAPGSYQIETDLTTAPAEYRFSPQNQGSDDTIDSDADPATGRIPVTVTNGTDNLTYDTGMFKPPALGDVVWVDVDGDGIQDAGEPGLAGVTVTLFDDLDVQVGSMVTAADGSYGFSGLALGDYYVVFDLSTVPGGGYLFTTPNVGADDTVDSDADPITGRSQTVTLAVGETQTTLDAGAYLPVTIGDTVYEDLNGNGTQDGGEPGIDGVTVDLLNATGTTTLATTTTAGGGLYTFTTAPGSYQIDVDRSHPRDSPPPSKPKAPTPKPSPSPPDKPTPESTTATTNPPPSATGSGTTSTATGSRTRANRVSRGSRLLCFKAASRWSPTSPTRRADSDSVVWLPGRTSWNLT